MFDLLTGARLQLGADVAGCSPTFLQMLSCGWLLCASSPPVLTSRSTANPSYFSGLFHRWPAAQQVLQPSVQIVQQVLEQLRTGTAWPQLPASAEVAICHQLARVKAVLDGRLLLQQHLRHDLSGPPGPPGGSAHHTPQTHPSPGRRF